MNERALKYLRLQGKIAVGIAIFAFSVALLSRLSLPPGEVAKVLAAIAVASLAGIIAQRFVLEARVIELALADLQAAKRLLQHLAKTDVKKYSERCTEALPH